MISRGRKTSFVSTVMAPASMFAWVAGAATSVMHSKAKFSAVWPTDHQFDGHALGLRGEGAPQQLDQVPPATGSLMVALRSIIRRVLPAVCLAVCDREGRPNPQPMPQGGLTIPPLR